MAKFLYKIFLFEPYRRVENFVRNYWHKFINFSLARDFCAAFSKKAAQSGAEILAQRHGCEINKKESNKNLLPSY